VSLNPQKDRNSSSASALQPTRLSRNTLAFQSFPVPDTNSRQLRLGPSLIPVSSFYFPSSLSISVVNFARVIAMRSRSLFVGAFFLFAAAGVSAEKLTITSAPPGATVEINGIAVGTTPFEKDYPGGYFHRTHTSLGSRLEHPLVARLNLAGYATKEIPLTEGPMEWISLNGHKHGEYFLFKTNHFDAQLDSIAQTFTGEVSGARNISAPAVVRPELTLEEIVSRAKPAVLFLKGPDRSGTGFFVSDTGVIATNAHVARGEGALLARLPSGTQLEAKVVFLDADLDIALLKVEGENLPALSLADASATKQGAGVLAIGNPGDAMLFSVTKGIVSAVGPFPSAGPGTWIQTDAPINPGNSGGPLLNMYGEVIGISTLKLVKKNTSGIGFALSASDLMTVLRRFYPNAQFAKPPETIAVSSDTSAETPVSSQNPTAVAAPAPPPQPEGTGTVTITSDPDAAEIYVDEKFVGNVPATLKLAVGPHEIVLKFPGRPDWRRTLEVLKGNKVSLKATFDPASQ
jgi:S1-C subfamily serine protease